MLEKILDRRNVEKALRSVLRNGGSAGVDGMQTDELRDFLNASYQTLRQSVLDGTYKPQPVKEVTIPKPQGGHRKLGIPTVVDRLLQQCIHQWLNPFYDPSFSKSSYGFRPGRSAHQAVLQAQYLLNTGRRWIVELDLDSFFDRVNHDRLISLLSKQVSDKATLRLIRQYLRSGVLYGGLCSARTEGTPQGSPLSPLLSNIILDELDKELESRGLSFIRYADDCSIYVRSEASAQRVLRSISVYIERKLLLKVNHQKSHVSTPTGSNLLGFSFYSQEGQWRIRLGARSAEKIKRKCREITSRNNGTNLKEKLSRLRQVISGWVNYFKLADASKTMSQLDKGVRTRLRMCIWKEWKIATRRVQNLLKHGASQRNAYEWGNSSKGYCRLAHSPCLCTVLNNGYLAKLGYTGFLLTYQRQNQVQTSLF